MSNSLNWGSRVVIGTLVGPNSRPGEPSTSSVQLWFLSRTAARKVLMSRPFGAALLCVPPLALSSKRGEVFLAYKFRDSMFWKALQLKLTIASFEGMIVCQATEEVASELRILQQEYMPCFQSFLSELMQDPHFRKSLVARRSDVLAALTEDAYVISIFKSLILFHARDPRTPAGNAIVTMRIRFDWKIGAFVIVTKDATPSHANFSTLAQAVRLFRSDYMLVTDGEAQYASISGIHTSVAHPSGAIHESGVSGVGPLHSSASATGGGGGGGGGPAGATSGSAGEQLSWERVQPAHSSARQR
ncbi:uncharacterized protein AMSG_12208 [Thecamonas trahens ATCC 50062]|uniref:Uncharacterized protein n=1 Tax=Thecamonas trahens ATCC 50062 TaxID=461836 RepID=A0A0L0DM06_THETB|nr:hypothetical protein AMSG_12208 [Thecamonas trahens ATCC 50062]KNC53354.1 hypothetical protein AMSG_12208 [Thecamonas trahens ATCC 50062]|eukprot:XP_013754484.1 hypothetical protein AMSG_12208 [Thecamonas trahens ATCC 50062]